MTNTGHEFGWTFWRNALKAALVLPITDDTWPEEGDTKETDMGTLVFRDGVWELI